MWHINKRHHAKVTVIAEAIPGLVRLTGMGRAIGRTNIDPSTLVASPVTVELPTVNKLRLSAYFHALGNVCVGIAASGAHAFSVP